MKRSLTQRLGSQACKEELDAFFHTEHIHVTNFNFHFDFFYLLSILISFFILISICLINCFSYNVNYLLICLFSAPENFQTFKSHRILSVNAVVHSGPKHETSKAESSEKWGEGRASGGSCSAQQSPMETQNVIHSPPGLLTGEWGSIILNMACETECFLSSWSTEAAF